jgi:hypothetical protein
MNTQCVREKLENWQRQLAASAATTTNLNSSPGAILQRSNRRTPSPNDEAGMNVGNGHVGRLV